MNSPSNRPKFHPDDEEFHNLFDYYLPQTRTEDAPSWRELCVRQSESTHTLGLILREYLRDFQRHTLEKQGQHKELWEKAGFSHAFWWRERETANAAGLKEGMPSSMDLEEGNPPLNVPRRTKWQDMAEALFRLYLKMSQFNASDGGHLKQLVHLLQQAQAHSDEELVGIIQNYFSTLN